MKLYIEQGLNNTSGSGKMIAGWDTWVYLIDDDGNKIDFSNMVRSADVRLHMGEVATATLEVFVTGFEGNVQLEEMILREIKPRKWWRRKLRDVTAFGHRDGAKRFA